MSINKFIPFLRVFMQKWVLQTWSEFEPSLPIPFTMLTTITPPTYNHNIVDQTP